MASYEIAPVFHGDYVMAYPAPVTLRPPSEGAVPPAKVLFTPFNSSRSPPTIQHMPSDVLYYIFKLGVDNENADAKFPIMVSQVCSYWRRVALQCPLLWTKIHISSARAMTLMRSGGEVLPWASAFAARSASCPLDIKLNLKRLDTTPIEMREILVMHIHLIISTAVDFLACVHDRVRSLDVVTDFKEVTFLMSYKLVPRGLPLLESWTIKFGSNLVGDLSAPGHSIFHIHPDFDASGERGRSPLDAEQRTIGDLLPRLRNLQMSQVVANWGAWRIGGLTSLTIGHVHQSQRPTMRHLRAILAMNSCSLESLELQGCLPVHPLIGFRPLRLPKLSTLRIGYFTQDEALRFLPHIDVPALKSLALCDISTALHRHHRRAIRESLRPARAIYHEADSSKLLHELYTTRSPLLAQLESLELMHVHLYHTPYGVSQDRLCDQLRIHRVCAVRFLLSMPSLKSLTLIEPDIGFLDGLNEPILSGNLESGNGIYFFPGFQLATLRIIDAEYDDLVDFLLNRADQVHSPTTPVAVELPVFDTLEFTLEAGMIPLFKMECYECDHGRGKIDIHGFAKQMTCSIYREDFNPFTPYLQRLGNVL
ncbi:hypothetical protein EDD16DRAFT_1125195 [Pisolithus croceorrhizus]|nr:hypothetical protein EDD16DRAFT_1125195 [Pisolithus croceorrhizus]KAI6133800.1 hypothetical protein EV401DRAFT_1575383 [Pisolithus croceorrhizus]